MTKLNPLHCILPIHHSRTMTEPVHRDAVVVLVTPPASQWLSCVTCEYVGHLIFNLHIDRCALLGIYINFFLELTVWGSRLWSLVCCDASLYACSV